MVMNRLLSPRRKGVLYEEAISIERETEDEREERRTRKA